MLQLGRVTAKLYKFSLIKSSEFQAAVDGVVNKDILEKIDGILANRRDQIVNELDRSSVFENKILQYVCVLDINTICYTMTFLHFHTFQPKYRDDA